MADDIRSILQLLRDNQSIRETRFTSSFLNNAAEIIVSQRDLDAATTFVGPRFMSDDGQIRAQARVLNQEVIPVLRGMSRLERRFHIVGAIIKMLPALQNEEFKL